MAGYEAMQCARNNQRRDDASPAAVDRTKLGEALGKSNQIKEISRRKSGARARGGGGGESQGGGGEAGGLFDDFFSDS
jgi:hypothetical protein